jgi:hypothetical protein
MKTLLAGALLLTLAGCYTNRELEAEMVRAEVIRIDTIERYHLNVPTKQKQITWRDSDNLEYVTYVPMYAYFIVGSSMTMLRPR